MTHTEMCDRIDELEAENKALALRLDTLRREYESLERNREYWKVEADQRGSRLDAALAACRAMAEDGWLHYGPEGMSEPQKLLAAVVERHELEK